MNFEFSDDQRELQTQARRFLSEQSPPAVARGVFWGEGAFARGCWGKKGGGGWWGGGGPGGGVGGGGGAFEC